MTTRQEQIETLAKAVSKLKRDIGALQRLEPGYRGAGRIQPSELSTLLATQFFTANDGLLLLGPHDEITPTSWTSRRGQTATISGAFHQVAGAWPGTRALVVVEGTTNYVENPVFYENVTDGWMTSVASSARVTDRYVFEGASCKITAGTGSGGILAQYVSIPNGDSFTVSAWFYQTSAGDATLRINLDGVADPSVTVSKVNEWERVTLTWENTTGAAVNGRLYARNARSDSSTQIWVDGCQQELQDHATAFGYGDMGTGYAWSGAAHNSNTTVTETEVNLDSLVHVVNQTTFSGRAKVQMPLDSDDMPDAFLWYAYLDLDNRIWLKWDAADARWELNVRGGGTTGTVAYAGTFERGDWVDLIITIDHDNDEYELYIDGELQDTDTTTISMGTLDQFNLGGYISTGYATSLAFTEFAVLDSILTAEQVAALYQRNAPLVDAGAFSAPVYDGRFVKLAVSEDDVSATPTDAELTDAFGVQPDGFMALLDDAGAGTTVYKVWRAGGSWWYESLTQAT